MMNKLLLGAGLALALAACASTPPPKPAQTAAAAKVPVGCVPETASRIPPSAQTCAGFGHTWTQDDISRTGQPDAGGALKLLDPSLTIQGH